VNEFLVRQSNRVPPTSEGKELRARLQPLERERAQELRDAGILVRLWRVPGTRDSIGLYRAADATALHEALASLPMFPWMEISVEALATHPQEQRPG
jgi:muconolactone delta-isomerase